MRRWMTVPKVPLLRMEIVKRSDDMKGFVVLPPRWVVERTFSLVRTKRAPGQRFREPRRNPGHLRDPSPCSQAAWSQPACQGLTSNYRLPMHHEQGPQRYGEGTFAGSRGNDGVAPRKPSSARYQRGARKTNMAASSAQSVCCRPHSLSTRESPSRTIPTSPSGVAGKKAMFVASRGATPFTTNPGAERTRPCAARRPHNID